MRRLTSGAVLAGVLCLAFVQSSWSKNPRADVKGSSWRGNQAPEAETWEYYDEEPTAQHDNMFPDEDAKVNWREKELRIQELKGKIARAIDEVLTRDIETAMRKYSTAMRKYSFQEEADSSPARSQLGTEGEPMRGEGDDRLRQGAYERNRSLDRVIGMLEARLRVIELAPSQVPGGGGDAQDLDLLRDPFFVAEGKCVQYESASQLHLPEALSPSDGTRDASGATSGESCADKENTTNARVEVASSRPLVVGEKTRERAGESTEEITIGREEATAVGDNHEVHSSPGTTNLAVAMPATTSRLRVTSR